MADLYEVLGVAPTVDARDLRRAYLRLAQQYHPDHNPRPEAGAKFLELQAAYEVLGDTAKRQRYDARRSGAPGPGDNLMRSVQGAPRPRAPGGPGREQGRPCGLGNVRISVKVRLS